VPSILPGAGWKVEVNLPLANGAAAELDVVMLETVSRRKDVMVKGVVRGTSDRRASASLSAPQPDDSTGDGETTRGGGGELAGGRDEGRPWTHGDGETMRRRAEEAGWRAATTRAGCELAPGLAAGSGGGPMWQGVAAAIP